MTDYKRLARNFISGVNKRRAELIIRENRKDNLSVEECKELRSLQEAVGAVATLAFPLDSPFIDKLEGLLGIPSPCPRCGRVDKHNEEANDTGDLRFEEPESECFVVQESFASQRRRRIKRRSVGGIANGNC